MQQICQSLISHIIILKNDINYIKGKVKTTMRLNKICSVIKIICGSSNLTISIQFTLNGILKVKKNDYIYLR